MHQVMKRLLPHISIFVLMIFTITSVMQYHHHDCDGNIYIHLTTFDDLVIGASEHAIEHCKHDHPCNSHHRHGQHHESCSMHLGDYKASETATIATEWSTMTTPMFLCDNAVVLPDDVPVAIMVIDAEYYDCRISECISSASALRAPPVS